MLEELRLASSDWNAAGESASGQRASQTFSWGDRALDSKWVARLSCLKSLEPTRVMQSPETLVQLNSNTEEEEEAQQAYE